MSEWFLKVLGIVVYGVAVVFITVFLIADSVTIVRTDERGYYCLFDEKLWRLERAELVLLGDRK